MWSGAMTTKADFSTWLEQNGSHPLRITERGCRGIRSLTPKLFRASGGHSHAEDARRHLLAWDSERSYLWASESESDLYSGYATVGWDLF